MINQNWGAERIVNSIFLLAIKMTPITARCLTQVCLDIFLSYLFEADIQFFFYCCKAILNSSGNKSSGSFSKRQQYEIDFNELIVDADSEMLGKGAFGIVYRAKWRGKGT